MIIKVSVDKEHGNGDVFRLALNTGATAADHLKFIENIINPIQEDKESLEKEANASNKTMNHDLFNAVGAIAIKPIDEGMERIDYYKKIREEKSLTANKIRSLEGLDGAEQLTETEDK